MAVLNLTPDSFSDGGKFSDPDRAFAHALEMEEQGADIIDIGAESTRPGSARVSATEELRRLVPVLKRLKDRLTIPISVDTYKAEVAERALELGAEIVNDPSGLTFEPHLARVISNYDAGLVLNHMRGRPETWAKLGPLPDPMAAIGRDLDAAVSRARHEGVDRARIAIDPGIGFGKRKEQNSLILGHLAELAGLDLPILVGPSRKEFLAHSTPEETRFATAAAVTAAILGGAHLVRVHDVREMRAAADVADEILRN
jgi:dihydropteroate synthase